ncbi:pentapeptide repeat-containing protein [Moorena bouillonii]|uniref:pentapeptide repeat-containing protein n=1 Tax=Moorena bouillonii TaxID=207920 RepID=UPI00117D2B96
MTLTPNNLQNSNLQNSNLQHSNLQHSNLGLSATRSRSTFIKPMVDTKTYSTLEVRDFCC